MILIIFIKQEKHWKFTKFFEFYEIRKDGYFRNKNSLSLKLTDYFTIKNEKLYTLV
jgi:hypothetical protein